MKNLATLFFCILIGLTFTHCFKNDPPPVRAGFSAPTLVDAGEYITFDNLSSNAGSYQWDFGDGNGSFEYEPTYYYQEAGLYTVTLTAFSQHNYDEDVSQMTIEVLPATELDILVMYEGSDVPVPNCSVRLYETENDWANETNILIDGYTDSQGYVLFTYLQPIKYYIDAYKDDNGGFYCNWNLGYITDPLIAHTTNAYNIYVEYVSGKKRKTLKIIKVEQKR